MAFDLQQFVASDNSEPFGIVMMDAFAPLADCVGSGTCLGTAVVIFVRKNLTAVSFRLSPSSRI